MTYSQFRNFTYLSRTTYNDIVARVKTITSSNRFTSKARTGALLKVDLWGERRLLRAASLDTRATLQALGSLLKSGIKMCCSTVRTVLKRNGKARRVTRKKPYLSKEHRERRKE